MKKFYACLILILFMIPSVMVNAQPSSGWSNGAPLKQGDSPMFGTDVVIHNEPDRDQRNVAICSAFNGWLYAVYSYYDGIQPMVTMLRSTDKGLTWSVLFDGTSYYINNVITKFDIMACGNSISELKIYLIEAVYDPIGWGEYGWVWVGRYNGEPFSPEVMLLEDQTSWNTDIAIASDQNFPAVNSSPYSIAIAYSKHGVKDSLLFYSSSNGGMSFDNKRVVATSDQRIEKVALSYGRSSSKPEGRYFVAWEEKFPQNALLGHVYTAHSEPYFNSPFTTPVCLDSIVPNAINQVRNPSIACQANNVDNDSSNLTKIVMMEKYHPDSSYYETVGFYNMQATSSRFFNDFRVVSTSGNSIQPDVRFNPYDSTFMLTYFDSEDKKLPYAVNNFNLTTPDSWNFISNAYNDSGNITAPDPQVKLNYEFKTGINCWVSDGSNSKGVALFDAPYHTYTDIQDNCLNVIGMEHGVFPNPCSREANIWFKLLNPGNVRVSLYDILGNYISRVENDLYPAGKSIVKLNTSALKSGCYYYRIEFKSTRLGGILIVNQQ
jgi:hypothetical protein